MTKTAKPAALPVLWLARPHKPYKGKGESEKKIGDRPRFPRFKRKPWSARFYLGLDAIFHSQAAPPQQGIYCARRAIECHAQKAFFHDKVRPPGSIPNFTVNPVFAPFFGGTVKRLLRAAPCLRPVGEGCGGVGRLCGCSGGCFVRLRAPGWPGDIRRGAG